jgi:hypothetical protein
VDKSKNLEHHADAAGYLIMAEFPIVMHRIGEATIRFAV